MSEIRDQFFQSLQEELSKASIDDSDAIYNDLSTAYDDKLEKGMTDMEIIISLGDTYDIVKDIKNNPLATDEEKKARLEESFKETVNELVKCDLNENKESKRKKRREKPEKPKKAKKVKPRFLTKTILFFAIIITSILIPVGFVYGGLNFLLPTPLYNRIITGAVSISASIILIIFNKFLRSIVKGMVIRKQLS